MKNHKDDEHTWCRRCGIDFEDDDDLFTHKVESEDHIACHACGEDFRTEGGRDHHHRQVLLPNVVAQFDQILTWR